MMVKTVAAAFAAVLLLHGPAHAFSKKDSKELHSAANMLPEAMGFAAAHGTSCGLPSASGLRTDLRILMSRFLTTDSVLTALKRFDLQFERSYGPRMECEPDSVKFWMESAREDIDRIETILQKYGK